jgi:hypothetical protein
MTTTPKEITQFSRIEYEQYTATLQLLERGALNHSDTSIAPKYLAMEKLYELLKDPQFDTRFLGGFKNVKTIRVMEGMVLVPIYALDAPTLEKKKWEAQRAAQLAQFREKPPQPPAAPKAKKKHQLRKDFLQSRAGAKQAYDAALKQRERQKPAPK